MIDNLSDEDVGLIKYFWEEYGDVTRWTGWNDALPIIQQQYPELIKALNDFAIARRMVGAVIKSID